MNKKLSVKILLTSAVIGFIEATIRLFWLLSFDAKLPDGPGMNTHILVPTLYLILAALLFLISSKKIKAGERYITWAGSSFFAGLLIALSGAVGFVPGLLGLIGGLVGVYEMRPNFHLGKGWAVLLIVIFSVIFFLAPFSLDSGPLLICLCGGCCQGCPASCSIHIGAPLSYYYSGTNIFTPGVYFQYFSLRSLMVDIAVWIILVSLIFVFNSKKIDRPGKKEDEP